MLGIPYRSVFRKKFPFTFAAKYVRASFNPAALMWNPPSRAWTPRTPGGNVWPSAYNLKACSTAVIHSSRPSSAVTSPRLSSNVSMGFINLLHPCCYRFEMRADPRDSTRVRPQGEPVLYGRFGPRLLPSMRRSPARHGASCLHANRPPARGSLQGTD